MYTLSDLRSLVYRDMAQGATANDRLDTTRLDQALNHGYVSFALDVYQLASTPGDTPRGIWLRTATVPLTTGVNTLAFPQDMIDLRVVSYGATTAPLRRTSLASLEYREPTWQATAAGTPDSFYLLDARNLALYPAPSFTGSKSALVHGLIVPFSIGGGITTLARTGQGVAATTILTATRASNVVTVETAAGHGLAATDTALVAGVTAVGGTTFNGTVTVVANPTPTSFTYAQTAANDTGTGGSVRDLTDSIVTVTTARAHNLTLSDAISIAGTTPVGATVFDGGPFTLLSASGTTFTYREYKVDDTATGGIAYYSTGVPTLTQTTSVPLLPANYQVALVHHAVWSLGASLFADDEAMQVRVASAKNAYDALCKQYVAVLL